MAYKLTPADRRARAELIRAQRDQRFAAQKRDEELRRIEQRAAVQPTAKPEKKNAFLRGLATVGDLSANLATGAAKGVEGIADMAAAIMPYTGGIFGLPGIVLGQIFKDEIKEFVERDHVGTVMEKPLQTLAEQSYLSELGKGGEITRQVASGVGQMLPAVAVTALTGGAGASAAVSQAASLATTAVSAAGNATEEAFKEGASYEKGLLYGAASGAVEAGTEKLMGGLGGLYGKGVVKGGVKAGAKSVASTGIKRVAKEALGEAAEEALAEGVNPALKTIYKGKDALKEYSDEDFWADVGEAALIGGLTSPAYSGTVGRVMKTGGVYADANSVLEHIGEQQKLRAKSGLSQAERVQVEQNIKVDQELLSKRLQRLSEGKRAKVLEKMPALSAAFEADGSIKADQLAALDANIQAAGDATYNVEYRTPTLDKDTIAKVLKNGAEGGEAVEAFNDTMDAEQRANYAEFQEVAGAISERSGNVLRYIVSKTSPKGGAYYDPTHKVWVIGAEQFKNGTASKEMARNIIADVWQGTTIHEVAHATEDTTTGKALGQHLASDESVLGMAVSDYLSRDYSKEYFGEDKAKAKDKLLALIAKADKGESLTEQEQKVYAEYRSETSAFMAQRVLGTKSFIKKLIQTETSTAEKVLNKVRELYESFKNRKSKDAQNAAEYLHTAEQLYLNALSEVGGTYQNGKIHLANREEDKEKSPAEGEVRRLAKERISDAVDKAIANKGKFGERYNQMSISAVPQEVAALVDKASNSLIDISNKMVAVNGDDLWHEYNRHSNVKIEQGRQQIAFTPQEMKEAIEAIYSPDVVESVFADPNNPTQRQSFAYAKKSPDGHYVVVEAVGGKRNPNIVPVMILQFSETKWNRMVADGKTLGELLYENDSKLRISLDVDFNKKNRVTAAQFASSEAIANTPRSPRSNISITENEPIVKQNAKNLLENRVFGDDLLNAQDLISDVRDLGAEVDERGYITLYHRTSASGAAAIRSTGMMVAKEDGLFFSTKENGQNVGYGNTVVTFKIPAEKLVLDDVFDDEAHLRYPLDKPGRVSMKEYLAETTGNIVRRSRTASGDVVTISKGEMAKLHANYAGDKVFDKKSVTEALKGIDALQGLPADIRKDFVNRLWTGYNQRLHAQGFEQFTEVMWHQIHATVLQENGFEMTEAEIAKMDEQIVNALHQIVASGKQSIKAKLESDTSTEGYRKQANYWREEHTRTVERNKLLGRVKFEAEKLANMKAGRYVNAANYKNQSFAGAITELARLNWRGGLVRDQKIREHFAALDVWYSKENPLYKGDGNGNELFRQEIKDALSALGNAQNGALTNDDLLAAETVIKYFAHEIEAHNTVYKDGKRVDAMPEAKRYVENVARAKEIAVKCGIWQRLTRSGFARMVADPAMLMRQADGYLDGFFTEQFEQLRQGTIDAAVLERELAEDFEKFWDEHKAYGKRYNNANITFDGKELPLQEAISLYMTMKREHAFAGLAGAGFEIDGKDATENVSDGFVELVEKLKTAEYNKLPPEELLTLTKEGHTRIEQAALEKAVAEKRKALFDQFTAEDKALISLMEKTLEQCRDVKVRIDEIVQGYSNVTGGYYFPIKRTGLAENVDAFTGFEGDRVSNLSINKDTVKNAHKLFIEPAHIVFMRHVKAISLYHGLGVFTDNFNRLYNLNTVENVNNPTTVRTALGQSNKYAKEMLTYFKELKQDVEGISKKRHTEKFYNDAVAYIRSAYATYQLGFNPKVWVTQLSSLVAATNILDADALTKGFKVSGKDVDEYCRLAWLRNNDNAAAMAQAVETPQNVVQRAGRGALRVVRDASMSFIGKVDRLVIQRLFGACQVQVEKQGGAKIGTKENKVEAGKLLQRVILETQQNSLATERSAAMRSGDELLKGFTMFSADAMKVGARFVDAFGELSALRTLLKAERVKGKPSEAEIKRLEAQIKAAKGKCVRTSVSLVGTAIFNALIAYGFKWLYRRDEEENAGTVLADTFGNMLGGIPFVRDLWSFFQDGFEMDHFLISTVNDVLGTAAASFELVKDAASGKEVTRQQALANIRKVLYAAGQLSGVPTRNVYNVSTGIINRVAPAAGYKVESNFYKQPYSADLQKAIDAGDERMVGTIAGLMVGEKIHIEDETTRATLEKLAGKGYSVLPRSVGDTVSVDGEELALSGKQQKKLREIYAIGEEAVSDMCKLKQFSSADEAVQEKAIRFVYDVYWDLALEGATGRDLAEKNVLFAEAIPIEKLAVIIATARAIEADKDKSGKAISGSKKRKIQTFVNSLHLTAAQKYMVMGYLGYSNINGEQDVNGYISTLKLSKTEKTALLKYSGYGT